MHPAGIGFYLDTHRVHVATRLPSPTSPTRRGPPTGPPAATALSAYRAVAQLNARARHDRLTAGGAPFPSASLPSPMAPERPSASLVITRRNDPARLRLSPTNWVTEGNARRSAPSTTTAPPRADRPTRADGSPYRGLRLAAHVRLGSATTHPRSARGTTTDTSHTAASDRAESRQRALRRAPPRPPREPHLRLAMRRDGAATASSAPTPPTPPPPVTCSERILPAPLTPPTPPTTTAAPPDRPGPPRSRRRATRYHDALATAAVHVLGGDWASRIDTLADRDAPALTGPEPDRPTRLANPLRPPTSPCTPSPRPTPPTC